MDGQRFDDLAKAIATRATRRRTLKMLAGASIVGVVGYVGLNKSSPPPDVARPKRCVQRMRIVAPAFVARWTGRVGGAACAICMRRRAEPSAVQVEKSA